MAEADDPGQIAPEVYERWLRPRQALDAAKPMSYDSGTAAIIDHARAGLIRAAARLIQFADETPDRPYQVISVAHWQAITASDLDDGDFWNTGTIKEADDATRQRRAYGLGSDEDAEPEITTLGVRFDPEGLTLLAPQGDATAESAAVSHSVRVDVESPQSIGGAKARGPAVASGRAEANLAGDSTVDPVRWADFAAAYELRANDVRSAAPPAIPPRLERWFSHVDGLPGAAALVRELESLVDWPNWIALAGPNGMVWSPDQPDVFLGQQLALCRRLSVRELHAQQVAENYWNIGGRLSAEDAVRIIVLNVFDPMQTALLGRLAARAAEPPSAPASDRIVQLDHNSEPFRQAVAGLDELQSAIPATNLLDVEEREQIAATVAAGRRLFTARGVRVAAVTAVLLPVLGFLMALSPEFGIGLIAHAVYDAVKAALRWAQDV